MLGMRLRSMAVALVATAVTAMLAQAGLGALGAPEPVAAPRISSAPFTRTIATRATVAFDGRIGLAYTCAVDGRPTVACTSPVTFRGLRPGPHRVVVRARRGTDASADASYSWLQVSPRPDSPYEPRRTPSANGTPVRPVLTTAPIRPWTSRSATFAWLARPGTRTTCRIDRGRWRTCSTPATYPGLRLGPHEFAVRAVSSTGRSSAVNLFRWTITGASGAPDVDAPVLQGTPSGSTEATSATISFGTSDGRPLPPGASYACSLDGGAWAVCTSPVRLVGLTPGPHELCVRIAVGSLAGPASCASWAVSGSTGPPGPPPTPSPGPITISGSLATALAPGTAAPLPLTLTNPTAVDVRVTALTVAIAAATSVPSCSATTNFSVTQSSLASSPTGVIVPAGSTVALPAVAPAAPVVSMTQLATNQDACKGATLTLLYSAIGSAP